jgi:hypothetical protein
VRLAGDAWMMAVESNDRTMRSLLSPAHLPAAEARPRLLALACLLLIALSLS